MIGEKIIKIMSEIEPIKKTEVDEEKNYKFAKSEEIIGMVLTMKYQFIDVEDENKDCIEVEILGSGYDEKGRAVYTALTRRIQICYARSICNPYY